MISIESSDGSLIKVFPKAMEGEYGIHQMFGFTSQEKAATRAILRKRQGYDFTPMNWHCTFKVAIKDNQISLSSFNNCEAIAGEANTWNLKTSLGDFKILGKSQENFSQVSTRPAKGNETRNTALLILAIMAIFIPILFFSPQPLPEKVMEETLEPLEITILKPVQTVNVNTNPVLTTNSKTNNQAQKALDFLGFVGDKNLKKAVGGVPTQLKEVSAGAGAGGKQGSGGEMLTGLGNGLRKTTVGNTGVSGLGGIGTKGAGGGAGGYGTTLVNSGNGKGISAVAVSNGDMVLDGGLSKYAINATIAKYINQVRRCYEDQLKNNPALEGQVAVDFEINGSGMLNSAKVAKSTLGSAAVEGCITQKMMSWQFPQPKGGVNVKVNYPFMLRPVGN